MTMYTHFPHNSRIWQDIADERDRQDAKWGDQSGNDNFVWTAVLAEEVGEAAQAALQVSFGGGQPGHLRDELVQTAAVCVAWIEAIDKRGEGSPKVDTVLLDAFKNVIDHLEVTDANAYSHGILEKVYTRLSNGE